MNKPDLDSVTTRRAMVVKELAELEKMRADLEAEDQDLVVAERVLKKLAETPASRPRTASFDTSANGVVKGKWDGPILES